MTPADLSSAVASAIRAAVADGDLAVTPPDTVALERPKNREHGDYATNVALQLAKPAGRPPREVAETHRAPAARAARRRSVDVAGPGFLNISLSERGAGQSRASVVTQAGGYGRSGPLAGQRINLEFVSANPTGPVHLGGDPVGRGR